MKHTFFAVYLMFITKWMLLQGLLGWLLWLRQLQSPVSVSSVR